MVLRADILLIVINFLEFSSLDDVIEAQLNQNININLHSTRLVIH